MADIVVQSFSAGELSPLLDGRSDLEKYYSGAREYVNIIPLPYGPAERRPGTYFVGELKYNSKKARLQSFQYSTEQAYILEFGNEYIRFFKDFGQIIHGVGTEDISALDNQIAHWLCNETMGTAVDDDVGIVPHDGTATADASILHADGKVGTGCFDLDGQYTVEIADHNDFSYDDSGDNPFSIACWAYVTQQDSIQVLLSKWRDLSTTREWRFSLSNERKLQLHLADSSTNLEGDRIAQWFLNDDAANTAVDDAVAVVPHDGVCSVNTDTISTTGKINDCFDFGGTVYVTVSDNDALSFGDGANDSAFSISAWIYVTNTGNSQMILSKYDTDKEEWYFSINSSEQLVFAIFDASRTPGELRRTTNSLTTGWHHVVATYSGKASADGIASLALYVDNESPATSEFESGYTAMENLTANVLIGANYSAGTEQLFFADKIDKVTLYDIELSAAQVETLWNDGNGIETTTGIIINAVADTALTAGWHQLACTYDSTGGATAADGIILYADGAAVDSTATNDTNYTAMQNGAEEIRIGSQRNSADSANEKFWGNKIDEVSVFKDVLTPAEIASLYSTTPYEIASDYLEADLFGLQHAQSADVLYNVHGSYPQSKLIRYEHNLWDLENIIYDWPPFLSENITDTTITASATIGTVELTASAPIFTSDHIGSYWLIKHPRTDNKITHDFAAAVGYSPILVDVKGSWRLRTSSTWTGTIELQQTYDEQLVLVLDAAPASGAWSASDIITGATSTDTCIIVAVTDSTHYYIKQLSGSFTDGEVLSNQSGNSRDTAATWPRYEGWHTLETFQSTDDQNFNVPGEETLGNAYLRVECTEADDAALKIVLSCERYYHYGIVKITGFTSATSASATVIRTIGATTATKLWSEGAWSDERGYPVTTSFYEGRLWQAGTPYRPLDILGSRVNDYDNMERGTLDDDSVRFTVDSSMQNMIRWLVGQEVLLIGTSGGEWRLGSSDPADTITPANPMRPRIQTTYGSKEIQALLIANAVLFVDKAGRKVRGAQYIFERGESGGYDAPDYTMLSEHITESGIVGTAFQQNPYPILWAWRTDGVLIGMVFEPGQKVWGWFRCVIDGLVESVAVEPGTPEDTIWIIVNRTINGSTKRYVEYFKPRDWGSDQADCFFVDSGLTFDGGAAVTITNITKANPGVVTAEAHGFSNGDNVKIADVVGMTEINNKVYTVAAAATDTFALKDKTGTADWTTLGYTAYTSGGTVEQVDNAFSGLGHLEGKTVSVLGDGSVHADVVVSSGSVTLTDFFNKVHIGLPFTSSLRPMKLAVPGANIRGKIKRIHQIIFSFYKTLGAKFGPTSGDETIPFRKTTDPMGAPPPLFTGEKTQTFPGGYELNADIYVEQTQPLPMTVRSITAKLAVFE